MATQVFQREEHEFVRLAALAQPDWEALRLICRKGIDWEYLERIAEQHQLDGVVGWRCLAPELGGIVPEAVRHDAREGLARLDGLGRAWANQAREALAPLARTAIPYVMASSVPAYALLGMPHWPREWADIDICIPSERWPEAKELLASDGVGEHGPAVAYLSRGEQPGRLPLEILTWGPDYDYLEQGISGAPFLFEQIEYHRLCDCDAPAPHAEAWAWLLADRLYGSITWTGAPLPVWGLARLHNICTRPGFDWGRLLAHMRSWNLRTQAQRELLATFPQAELPLSKREPLFSAGTNINLLLWVLHRVEEAYPGSAPDAFFAQAGTEFGERSPAICASQADDAGPMTFCWWHQPPSLEEMMFDGYGLQGLQTRLDAGWWRLAEPVEWSSMNAPRWDQQHLSPRLPRR